MSDLPTPHPETLTLFKAMRKQCDIYTVNADKLALLTTSGLLDLLRRPEAIEVTGGFVVDGPDPIVVLFVNSNAGEDVLESLPRRAQEMLTTARRTKLQTEIAAHRKQIEDLSRQLNELNRD